MRTPSSLVVVAVIGVAAVGCSRPKSVKSGDLDLVLDENARPGQVVSAVEIWGKAKTTPAERASSGAVAPLRAHRRAHTRRLAVVPRRAPGPEHAPAMAHDPQPAIAVAPAPAPAPTQPAPVPAQEPTPQQPADPQPGPTWGGRPEPTDGGGRFPGFPGGGVIIIRGGHSGRDPCDEHGRGGIGGFPGLPGGIGRRAPGGIVFLKGR